MKETRKNFHINTLVIHGGQSAEPVTGAVIPPIFQTSTYKQKAPGEHTGYIYTRTTNPTRKVLEDCLSSLEGMRFCSTFASGCATTTTLAHLFRSGDHLIVTDDCYGGTFRIFNNIMTTLGIEVDFVDMRFPERIAALIRKNTRCLWIETPTNPTLKIIDLERTIALAKRHKLLTIVDNTFMSPFFQNPGKFGADIVFHSTTKYINGHSDVIGGAAITDNPDLADRIYKLQYSLGAVPAPFDCWLALRGVKTLAVRMKRHEENALELAGRLSKNKLVEKVLYPGLKTHPEFRISRKQTSGSGGMISFYIKGGIRETRRFFSRLQLFTLAESLGGVESLVNHPFLMTHSYLPAAQKSALGITPNLVRMSVGIEHVDDLAADLGFALKK